jgi:hypothetical protein
MPSSGMLFLAALVRTDVSERNISSIIRVTRISQLGTTLAVTSKRKTLFRLLVNNNDVPSWLILVTLMMYVTLFYKTSFLTRATLCHIPVDGIFHSHRRENLKSYISNHIDDY